MPLERSTDVGLDQSDRSDAHRRDPFPLRVQDLASSGIVPGWTTRRHHGDVGILVLLLLLEIAQPTS
eukprot:5620964-Heterocapsa_arctica.AAC.1